MLTLVFAFVSLSLSFGWQLRGQILEDIKKAGDAKDKAKLEDPSKTDTFSSSSSSSSSAATAAVHDSAAAFQKPVTETECKSFFSCNPVATAAPAPAPASSASAATAAAYDSGAAVQTPVTEAECKSLVSCNPVATTAPAPAPAPAAASASAVAAVVAAVTPDLTLRLPLYSVNGTGSLGFPMMISSSAPSAKPVPASPFEGWGVEQVASFFGERGSAYEPYSASVRANGVTGGVLAEYASDGEKGVIELLRNLGVVNGLHLRVLRNLIMNTKANTDVKTDK